jgi:hypothetical protein
MQTVIEDFNTRAQEVNEYFLFLEGLIQETTQLSVIGENGEAKIHPINSELAKTLKANGFLLLYNLVESTMRNAIAEIFQEIKVKNISFDLVRREIKKVVIQNFKNRSADNVYSKITNISLDIITAGFNPREIFSGNVDGKEITKTARKYGFSYDTDYSKTKHGQNLYTVMENRNDLAHGNKSFAEVGKDTTIEDLLKIKEEVIEYLQKILQNIEEYLSNEEYLDSSINKP